MFIRESALKIASRKRILAKKGDVEIFEDLVDRELVSMNNKEWDRKNTTPFWVAEHGFSEDTIKTLEALAWDILKDTVSDPEDSRVLEYQKKFDEAILDSSNESSLKKASKKRRAAALDVDTITKHYKVALLWAAHIEFDETDLVEGEDYFEDDNFEDHGYSVQDFTSNAEKQIKSFIQRFVKGVGEDILSEFPAEQVGHDIYLTQHGHGTGFWDRAEIYGEAGKGILTKTAEGLEEVNPFVNNNNQVEFG